jgi:signal transduction histidine kinase
MLRAVSVPEEHFTFSVAAASEAQKRLALAVVLGLFVIFILLLGPLSNIQTSRYDAFVPAYTMAMFVTDGITAVFLFAEFSIVRTRALLAISSGYLFNALIVIPWILTFPDVFVPGSLVGGLQSTPFIHFFWHAGFPTSVIAYALLKDGAPDKRYWRGSVIGAISFSIVLTVIVVFVAASIFIMGDPILPRMQRDPLHLNSQWLYLGVPTVLLSVFAFIALWTRRRSTLDFCLLIAMCAYGIEICLGFFPYPGRYTVNWYAGKDFSLLSSSVVLFALLYEITALYTRLQGALRTAKEAEGELRQLTGDLEEQVRLRTEELEQRNAQLADAKSELTQLNRVATAGELSAAIAHEIRQPITGMVTMANAALRWLSRDEPEIGRARDAMSKVVAAGHQASDVITNVRGLFGKDTQEKTPTDLKTLIQSVLAVVSIDLRKHNIESQVNLSEQLPPVVGNEVQLQQVILNLVMNAIESMNSAEPRVLSIKSEITEHNGVRVSIADTGSGIDPANLNRVFKAMFTTKARGMGMGLAICKSIIESHNGRIWVSAGVPRGSIFQFELPTGSTEN